MPSLSHSQVEEVHCHKMDYSKYREFINSDDKREKFLKDAIAYDAHKSIDSDSQNHDFYCIGYSKNNALNPEQRFWTGKINPIDSYYKAEITENVCMAKIYKTEDSCLTDLLLLKSFCRNDGLFFLVNIIAESPSDRLNNMEESTL